MHDYGLVNQLNDSHFRAISATGAGADDTAVAALTLRILGCDLFEEFLRHVCVVVSSTGLAVDFPGFLVRSPGEKCLSNTA